MHTYVGKDGKHHLTTAFNTPIAARIDTILHRLAEHIKRDNPTLQYDQAYAQALIYKLTTIPLVTGLVKVHHRFTSEPQRLAAILKHLVCT